MSDDEIQPEDLPSTWTSRNPEKPVIQPRVHPKKSLTASQKISNAEKRAINREAAVALNKQLDEFNIQRDEFIEKVAKDTMKKPGYIRDLLLSRSRQATPRKVNLHNALTHYMAKELNSDKSVGDRAKMPEIQRRLAEDDSLKDLSKDREQELLNALIEHRKVNDTGARSSNKGASLDYQGTLKGVFTELDNLSERTGSTAFTFVTRGHINDSTTPSFIDSDGALSFFTEVLNLDPNEVAGKFELWATPCTFLNLPTFITVRTPVETLISMRAECTKIISDGLRKILGLKNVNMSYDHYDHDIVSRHGVKLLGWPPGLPRISPSKIHTVEQIRSLRDALKVGDCIWTKLSPRQREHHTNALADKIAADPTLAKPRRKIRSDKGKKKAKAGDKRKRNQPEEGGDDGDEIPVSSDGGDVAPPRGTKKAKRASAAKRALPPLARSRSTIPSSDEDE
ncbi:hypothetical protein M413DRAFT_67836 [Hebeloma cylindrosporum]|uniref:Uncharacterized protein n=1 Tax=Hebeloma cylindrosporum TaxID=76867 RepID=A0A0C3C610_HEBCY|nr:hypothetical protein M413DRAFT_75315 [Hebeloma cylindrosporum h7]KIM44182.1 hypothetical protein M413DRAFT_67836 [Hebeloma cylindrosporum h7]